LRAGSILSAVEGLFEPEAVRPNRRFVARVGLPKAPVAPPRAPRRPPRPANPPPAEPPPSGLASPEVEARREALVALGSTLGPEDLRAVARIFIEDPDPELRRLAAGALGRAPRRVPLSLIQRGLADPDDRVRAAAARLGTSQGRAATPLLLAVASNRQWPLAQHEALRALPKLLAEPPGPRELDVERLVIGVGAMDPAPMSAEREAFGAIARAVGIARLGSRLHGLERSRLGAVRLLAIEGSSESQWLLSGLVTDPVPEIAELAMIAAAALGVPVPPSVPEDEHPREGIGPLPGDSLPEDLEDDVIAAVAAALGDPSTGVRRESVRALRKAPRDVLTSWCVRTIEGDDETAAALAAGVAQHLGLKEVAGALLQRASATSPQGRSAYLRALKALELDPEEVRANLVAAVDPGHRPTAVRLVWEIGGRAMLGALIASLGDSAGPVRMATLEVFAESGDPSLDEHAQRLLEADSSAAVRAAAVHALSGARPERRLAALSQAMADPDPDVRATAVDILPRGMAGEAAGLLLSALESDDERVWHASLGHLAEVPDRELPVLWAAIRAASLVKREELVRAVERADPERMTQLALGNAQAPDPADRELATQLASRAATTETTRLVLAALGDPDPGVRRTAATALSMLRTPTAVQALAGRLSDPQADVRVEAVHSLGGIDDDQVPAVLIEALKDPEVRVRDMAGEALSRWHSPAVARQLAAALSSPDLRRPAGDVLLGIGEAAVGALADVVVDGEVEAAAAAGSLLDRIAGSARFLTELASTETDRRLRAIEVLGAIGGTEAVGAVAGALMDPDVRIRCRAASILGRLGDPTSVPPLKRMFLSDPVSEAVRAAQSALRALGSVPEEGEADLLEFLEEAEGNPGAPGESEA